MKFKLLVCMLLGSTHLFCSEPAKSAAHPDDTQTIMNLMKQIETMRNKTKQARLELGNTNDPISSLKSAMTSLLNIHDTFIEMEVAANKLQSSPAVETIKGSISKQKKRW